VRTEPTTDELYRIAFDDIDEISTAKGRVGIELATRQFKRLALCLLGLVRMIRPPSAHGDIEAAGELVSVDRAARILGVSRSYIYEHANELPFVHRLPGGGVRVSVRRLGAYIEGH